MKIIMKVFNLIFFCYPFETQRTFSESLCQTELFCIMWVFLLYCEIQTCNMII